MLTMLFFATTGVFAQTPTAAERDTASPTEESRNNSLNQQINDLKDKIASRVAALKLVDKRGILGTVTEVEDTRLTILDPQQKTRIVDIDELTKFSSPSAKSTFGISDIKKGETVSIIGLYNKQSRRILGRFIEIAVRPVFITGAVSNIDADNFTLSVRSANNTTTIVDIEKITKTNSYADDEIVRSGFSKLSIGDRVVITGYLQKDKNRITGLRILQLAQAPKDPDIPSSSTDSQEGTEE
jgi:hypothetical protein